MICPNGDIVRKTARITSRIQLTIVASEYETKMYEPKGFNYDYIQFSKWWSFHHRCSHKLQLLN